MRLIDAGPTHMRQATSSPTPNAHATAAFTGDTCVTTTTSRSRASSASDSHADRTRAPSAAKDSPPSGAQATSARHAAHVSAGTSPAPKPSNAP